MQSSTFAAHTGLYLPSIKCHWEIEGAEGLMKTEPNKHNMSLSEYVHEKVLAFSMNSRSEPYPLKSSKGKPTALQTISAR
jgi:hypothetical protein